ncbi:hypothetical protein [Streptomyces cucumeris]|uniref:hypothetical protein n=1 Tax=Streptomyces cucumeris TaxID=2962890 RepID=UPI003D7367A0
MHAFTHVAEELASVAFSRLGDRVLSATPLEQSRHSGCVRLQLFASVRMGAVARALKSPGSFHPPFVEWIRGGSMWPMHEASELAFALEQVHPAAQCQLWHAVVEGEDLAQAEDALRQCHRDLYYERMANADCLRALAQSPDFLRSPLEPSAAEHLQNCPRCRALHDHLVDFDVRVSQRLPLWLLGWWPFREYQRNKEESCDGDSGPASRSGLRRLDGGQMAVDDALGSLTVR